MHTQETKETMGALENVDFSLGIKELAPGISPVVEWTQSILSTAATTDSNYHIALSLSTV